MSGLFHVLNRGVEKRKIFMDKRDYFRFVHGLFLFNTRSPAENTTYFLSNDIDLRNRYEEQRRIVDVHAWCLMPNHYHLLLSERIDNGLTLFMRKLNIGYANYFNKKYRRSGSLFQGRSKKILIERDAHFLHILHYIHLNPLDLLPGANKWRFQKVRDEARARKHIENYRWSSYNDYRSAANFPHILTTNVFRGEADNVEKETWQYLREMNLGDLGNATLEEKTSISTS